MNQERIKAVEEIVRDVAACQRHPFDVENAVLLLTCRQPEAQPRVIGEQYTKDTAYGRALDGTDVIRLYRKCNLGHVAERKKLAAAAWEAGEHLRALIAGEDGALDALRKASEACPGHSQKKRLILLSAGARCGSLLKAETRSALNRLNRDFAAECYDKIVDLLQPKAESSGADNRNRELARTQAALDRTRSLLNILQENFDRQLEESRAEEREAFFSKLNSDEYGHILDLLAASSRGFRQLRSKRIPVPMEIRSIQTLVRRMLEFAADCGVEPMREVGTRLRIRGGDLNGLSYEGTPFCSESEEKLVEIISPGWQILDLGVIISYPRVWEVKEEHDDDE